MIFTTQEVLVGSALIAAIPVLFFAAWWIGAWLADRVTF